MATRPGPVPKDALEYLKRKGLRLSWDHREVYREEHDRAFTVAKVTERDLLATIQEHVVRAIEEGRTLQQFSNDLTPILQQAGWWGRKVMPDPQAPDEEPREVQLGSPRRLKVIFDANMRTARAAGQWARAQRTKRARPFFIYELGPSERHRTEHEKLEGKILPVDDPFWDDWFPPNGWGCKCRVRQISRAETQRLGGESERPNFGTVQWTNHRTGATVPVPRGIDPGWDRNPGAYDDLAPVLRKRLDIPTHAKVRHDQKHERDAHFAGGRRVQKERRNGDASHVFDEGIDTRLLAELILREGTYDGQDTSPKPRWHRFTAKVGPIGLRIDRDGTTSHRLWFAELKIADYDGVWRYHLVPRRKPRKGGS